MAYMDLKTFEMWAGSNMDKFYDGKVEIDEAIAPVIRELNLKGYKTKFCCSGHPYKFLYEAFASSEEVVKATGGLVKAEPSNREDYPIRILYTMPDNGFYVWFDGMSSQDFPDPLPEGFWWDEDDDDMIHYTYSADDVFELLEERLCACRSLYQWAENLPARH